jgi:DNA replication protein DnaC
MTACPDCAYVAPEDLKRQRFAKAMDSSGFYGIQTRPFADFDPEQQSRATWDDAALAVPAVEAAQQAKADIVKWSARAGPFLTVLVGGHGVGKTMLAQAAARVVVWRGDRLRYILWEEFANETRDFDTISQYVRDLMEADWLILDDVGAASDPNDYLTTKLTEIIGSRFARNRETLIVGNMRPRAGQLPGDYWRERLGDRVADRMTDRSAVNLVSLWACQTMRPLNESLEDEHGTVQGTDAAPS